MWHTLKYTSGLSEKLVYVSEPIPEVHNYNVEVPTHTQQSESETEQDLLDITIRNSPTIIKEPLAPTTPIMQTPFFTELEELLNIAMGERGGGTGGNPSRPPGGGGPAARGGAAAQPVAAAANVKAMGKDPPLFHGERSKADTFMNEVEKYLMLNYDVAGFNSPKKKVILVLTFMQGPEVEEWTRGMLQWVQQINNQSNMDNIWCIFQQRFYNRFTNTQADSTARKELVQLKMRFSDIDSYIATFEQTVRKALYHLGSHEMNQQFLSGLPWDVAKDVMRYPTPITYQEHTEKALASVRSKVLL